MRFVVKNRKRSMMEVYIKLHEKWSRFLYQFIDGILSALLALTLFFDCFVLDQNTQISLVCVGMLLYLLYYCGNFYRKQMGKWGIFNMMLAFYRIVLMLS